MPSNDTPSGLCTTVQIILDPPPNAAKYLPTRFVESVYPTAATDQETGVAGLAAFLGGYLFWGLLIYGCAVGELTVKRVAVFMILWIVGRVALPVVPWEPAQAMFPSYAAILSIVLVLMIFKSDIRLT